MPCVGMKKPRRRAGRLRYIISIFTDGRLAWLHSKGDEIMLRALITATLVIGTSLAAVQAAAQDLVPCAREGGYCRVPYPTRVIYGAGGSHATRHVGGGGIACSNGVFGDPAPGVPKRCAYMARSDGRDGWRDRDWGPPESYRGSRPSARLHAEDGDPDWQRCARENGFCSFRGVRRVKYGAGGRFVERVSRNGIACNNAVFGDPTPGVPKVCLVLD
jgi:hypothetical protein